MANKAGDLLFWAATKAIEAFPEPWNAWPTGLWWSLEGQSPTKWISEITETIGSRHKITSALGQENDSSDFKTVPILKSNNTIYFLKSETSVNKAFLRSLCFNTWDLVWITATYRVGPCSYLVEEDPSGVPGSVHKTIPQPPSGVVLECTWIINTLLRSLLIWFKYSIYFRQ